MTIAKLYLYSPGEEPVEIGTVSNIRVNGRLVKTLGELLRGCVTVLEFELVFSAIVYAFSNEN